MKRSKGSSTPTSRPRWPTRAVSRSHASRPSRRKTHFRACRFAPANTCSSGSRDSTDEAALREHEARLASSPRWTKQVLPKLAAKFEIRARKPRARADRALACCVERLRHAWSASTLPVMSASSTLVAKRIALRRRLSMRRRAWRRAVHRGPPQLFDRVRSQGQLRLSLSRRAVRARRGLGAGRTRGRRIHLHARSSRLRRRMPFVSFHAGDDRNTRRAVRAPSARNSGAPAACRRCRN